MSSVEIRAAIETDVIDIRLCAQQAGSINPQVPPVFPLYFICS